MGAAKQEEEEHFDSNPSITDFHGNKRELLRRGLAKGSLSWKEIRKALPEEHLEGTELEVFIFTCRNLGIDVRES